MGGGASRLKKQTRYDVPPSPGQISAELADMRAENSSQSEQQLRAELSNAKALLQAEKLKSKLHENELKSELHAAKLRVQNMDFHIQNMEKRTDELAEMRAENKSSRLSESQKLKVELSNAKALLQAEKLKSQLHDNLKSELRAANLHVQNMEERAASTSNKVKELNCLKRIRDYYNSFGNESNDSKKKFLSFVVREITLSMQFPHLCEAQIELFVPDATVVETPTYALKKWTMENMLVVASFVPHSSPSGGEIKLDESGEVQLDESEVIGTITVAYRQPTVDEENFIDEDKPWLDEERRLLRSICSLVSLKLGCDEKEHFKN